MAALPAAGPLLVAGLKGLETFYNQLKTQQTLNTALHSIDQLYRWENFAWNVVNDVFGAAKGGEAISQGVSHDAGVKIEAIGHYVKDITEHTYETVIPHSLAWLYGYTESHDIVPLRNRMARAESSLRFLFGWRAQIDVWRRDWVDPNISEWRAWRAWFSGWPLATITQLYNWIHHPSTFGDWAAPYIVWPLIDYLAAHNDEKARDAFALVMVDAWAEDPNLTWEAVLRWLVAN